MCDFTFEKHCGLVGSSDKRGDLIARSIEIFNHFHHLSLLKGMTLRVWIPDKVKITFVKFLVVKMTVKTVNEWVLYSLYKKN